MEITYKTKKLERVCTDYSFAKRTYGEINADLIYQRIYEISFADTVEQMIQWHLGRCHPLKGNRKGQYAVDLSHPYRLIFEIIGNEIQIVRILEITDYH